MELLTEKVRTLMEANRRVTDGQQYTLPSPQLYPFQWLWDSCFHAIILSKFDVEAAKNELRSAFSQPLPSGMLPHIIYREYDERISNWGREMRGDIINVAWGVKGTSSITQPPIMPRAVWQVYEKSGDRAFVEEVYDTLVRHFAYLKRERTLPDYGPLLAIVNPDESGEDNSPRFDTALHLPAQQTPEEHLDARIKLMQQYAHCKFNVQTCMYAHFSIIDVPFNVIYAEGLDYMARITERIKGKKEAHRYEREARAVREAMREHLMVRGVFRSIDAVNGAHIDVETWADFMPLYGGLLSQAEAAELVAALLDKDRFWTDFPVATTALTEAAFDPMYGFWRGPVWHAPNWFLYHGLVRYGFNEAAWEVKQKTRSLLETFGFREQYNPLTGEGLGAENFTWGGLVLDME